MSRRSDVVVVTPEHVEVVLSPAGLGSRFLAISLDSVITTGIPLLLFRLLGVFMSGGMAAAFLITTLFFFAFVYHIYFETMQNGRSLGKRALRLRVVDSRGLPITVAQSAVRNALRAIDSLPALYGIGALTSLLDPHGRRLGDIVAETLVIEEPTTVEYSGGAISERRFNTLRTPRVLRQIRHRISLEERELLLELCMRAERLEPQRRYELMEQVGELYRSDLAIDDPRLSGENLVRDLTSILFSPGFRAESRKL